MTQDFQPAPLRPRGKGLDGTALLAALLVAFVAVALVKPWSWVDTAGSTGPGVSGSGGPHAAPSGGPVGSGAAPSPVRAEAAHVFPDPLILDVGEALPELTAQRAWSVATLVPAERAPPEQRRDVPSDFVVVRVGMLQDISPTTLGLDPRASHGPWVTRPPVVLWAGGGDGSGGGSSGGSGGGSSGGSSGGSGGGSILALALTYPEAQAPRWLTASAVDEAGRHTPIGLVELAEAPAGLRVLLAPEFRDGRPSPEVWAPGRYQFELDLGGRTAELTVILLDGPPWPANGPPDSADLP